MRHLVNASEDRRERRIVCVQTDEGSWLPDQLHAAAVGWPHSDVSFNVFLG